MPPEDSFVDTSALLHQRISRPIGGGDVVKGLFSWSLWSRMTSAPKGNLVAGKDQYYMDSMLVVGGPEGKIYHSSTLNAISDSFDFKSLVASVETSVKENS